MFHAGFVLHKGLCRNSCAVRCRKTLPSCDQHPGFGSDNGTSPRVQGWKCQSWRWGSPLQCFAVRLCLNWLRLSLRRESGNPSIAPPKWSQQARKKERNHACFQCRRFGTRRMVPRISTHHYETAIFFAEANKRATIIRHKSNVARCSRIHSRGRMFRS